MAKLYLGRHIFGLAAILFTLIDLFWRQFNIWEQIQPLGNVAHPTRLLLSQPPSNASAASPSNFQKPPASALWLLVPFI
jgi:hypothetical protein